jgi:hypothetical protein
MFFGILVQSVAAQTRFGIKAGLNTVDISDETLKVTDKEGLEQLKLSVDNADYGINIGLYLLAKAKNFYIQPELIYNSNATDYKLDDFDNLGFTDSIVTEKYQYLDVPIMLGLRLGALRIGGGPVGHVYLSNTSDLIDFPGYKQDFKNISWGWQAGLGLDLWAINLDVRYEGNLTEFGDHFNFFGNKFHFSDTPTRVIATIGISF